MLLLRYGRDALLVEVGSLEEVLALQADLVARPPAGTIETVPAARTLLVRFDAGLTSFDAVSIDVGSRKPQPLQAVPGELVELPVRYDGEDLATVADLTGLTVAEVVARHAAGEFTVAFLGLAPGFYFLSGLAPSLRVPRRASPRSAVPKGAVALAGEFSGIYPRTGPGGWQLIGHTDAELWDLTRHPSALLAPGTRVRCVAV